MRKKLFRLWPNENNKQLKNTKARYKNLETDKEEIIKEQQFLQFLGRNYYDDDNSFLIGNNNGLDSSNRKNIYNYKEQKEKNMFLETDGYQPAEREDIIRKIIERIDSPITLISTDLSKINNYSNNSDKRLINVNNKYNELSIGYSPNFMKYLLNTKNNEEIKEDKNNERSFNKSSIFKNNGNNITICNSTDRKRTKNLYYSPVLRKNLKGIFTSVNKEEDQSIKKSRKIQNDLEYINKYKYKRPFLFSETLSNSYNLKDIRTKKNGFKINSKYKYISSFEDMRKIKDKEDIEKGLFQKDEMSFGKLILNLKKRGQRRIHTENEENEVQLKFN